MVGRVGKLPLEHDAHGRIARHREALLNSTESAVGRHQDVKQRFDAGFV